MKTIVIIILLIIVLGLYFYTDLTKDVISFTGDFLVEKAREIVN
jgi:hypothetical protein